MKRALPLLLLFLAWPPAASAAILQADFSRPGARGPSLGLAGGSLTYWQFAASNPQAQRYAQQLSPRWWRGADSAWSMDPQLVQAWGAQPIHLLSSLWHGDRPDPRRDCRTTWASRPLPFQDWESWKRWLVEQAARWRQAQSTGPIWVDVWNEPDLSLFWPTVRRPRCWSNALVDVDGRRWLQTFLVTERTLRAELGSRLRIIGPSTAGNAVRWTERLLEFCRARGCQVDAVAWHVCGGTVATPGRMADAARTLLAEARRGRWRAAFPRPQLLITEYLPRRDAGRPGAMAGYWQALERSGASGALLADWQLPGTRLNSLLDRQARPRSNWWAVRLYQAGRAGRVRARSSSVHWAVLASRRGWSGGPEVLLGNYGERRGPARLMLRGLARGRWQARLMLLPPARGAWTLPAGRRWTLAVGRGGATVDVRVPAGWAGLLTLRR